MAWAAERPTVGMILARRVTARRGRAIARAHGRPRAARHHQPTTHARQACMHQYAECPIQSTIDNQFVDLHAFSKVDSKYLTRRIPSAFFMHAQKLGSP